MNPLARIWGKDVYVVEGHEKVIHCWADIVERLVTRPNLITLDRHVDTHAAFSSKACRLYSTRAVGNMESLSRKFCKEAGIVDGKAPPDSSAELKNTEHIDAAIVGEIINYAFVISFKEGDSCKRKTKASLCEEADYMVKHNLKEPSPDTPFTSFFVPPDKIVQLEPTCAVECEAEDHGQIQCDRPQANAAIESSYLGPKVDDIVEIGRLVGIDNVLEEPFVLDIDLDYFRTEKAIEPNNPSVFYSLIKKAASITVATEPWFVRTGALSGENIDSDRLRERLFQHFETALS